LFTAQRFFFSIAPRINRPGGTGRITQIHYAMAEDGVTLTPVVETLDVKYTVYAGHDHHLSPDLVQPHVELESRGRRQRVGQIVAAAAENENPNRTTALSAASPKQSQSMPMPKRAKSRSNRVFSAKKGKNELATAAPKPKATPRKKSTPTKRKPKNEAHRPKRSLFKIEESTTDNATMETGATGIPREITVDTSFSVASSVLPESEASCSPLGPDGIEMQRTASYDLDEMAGMQLNDGQWDEAALSKCNDDTMSDEGSDHRRSLRVLHLQLSPSHAESSLRRRKSSSLSATHLATGLYSVEGVQTPPKGTRSEKMKSEITQQKSKSHSNEQLQSAPTDNLATLRNVFDHGVKQARRFIGEVVSGGVLPPAEQPMTMTTTTTTAEDKRIRHFYGLLLDLLAECGDVIEMSSLAQTMANREDLDDFTDCEIESYLKELCERDRIMLSEGCIYKI
jgi:hypothetical protein